MRTNWMWRAVGPLALLVVLAPFSHAQVTTRGGEIFYSDLMRIEMPTLLTQGITLGETHYPLTRSGVGRLEEPMMRYDASALEFREYRRARTATTVWSLGGLALIGASSALTYLDYPILGLGSLAVGVGAVYAGMFVSLGATQHLYAAVNNYNRDRLAELVY